jgi:hypothetical protein
MALRRKLTESELELFTNKITAENKKDLQVYAAEERIFLYEAFNEALTEGLKALRKRNKKASSN